jgi:hypothetical protein
MAVKLFIVLLVLIGVAFFFTMSVGARRNNTSPLPDSDSDRTSYAQDHPPPAWIANLIGPLSPKLSLPEKEFRFAGANYVEVKVDAAKPRFRNATFRVLSGCRTPSDCKNVEILYQSNDGEGADLKLNEQAWQPSKDKPPVASLVVLQKGGTLRFRCNIAPSCTAELK